MDAATFKETAKRLKEANAVIAKLDPALREDAWKILRPYVSDEPVTTRRDADHSGDDKNPAPPLADADEDTLIEAFESDKDADNLYLTFAILYKRHGRGPYSLGLVKDTAKALGLDIPNRPDVTLRNSTRNMARKQADKSWKIQPGGETWLKETYGVKRGKASIPANT